MSDPVGFLAQFPRGAVLDEVQRAPELLSWLQDDVDQHQGNGRWDPTVALGDYFATYVERDLHQLIELRQLETFRRFVRFAAGRIGQLLNLSSLAADAGVSSPTSHAWMSLLETSYIVHRLPPWHANLGKRLVKQAKLYFCDVGLAAWLLGIRQADQIATHALRGALFENRTGRVVVNGGPPDQFAANPTALVGRPAAAAGAAVRLPSGSMPNDEIVNVRPLRTNRCRQCSPQPIAMFSRKDQQNVKRGLR